MTVIDFEQMKKGWATGGPVGSFVLLVGLLVLVVGVVAFLFFGNFVIPVFLFSLIGIVATQGLLRSYDHYFLGACNAVTLMRGAIVSLLTGAVVLPASESWIVFALASFALILDGIDGWLARRSGLVSQFGARFDMEVDAAFGAVLALVLLRNEHAGLEILVLGFTRYAFVLCGVFLTFLRGSLPESYRRKTICVVQIATLIALTGPLFPAGYASPVAWIAAILLIWSFAADVFWLHKFNS